MTPDGWWRGKKNWVRRLAKGEWRNTHKTPRNTTYNTHDALPNKERTSSGFCPPADVFALYSDWGLLLATTHTTPASLAIDSRRRLSNYGTQVIKKTHHTTLSFNTISLSSFFIYSRYLLCYCIPSPSFQLSPTSILPVFRPTSTPAPFSSSSSSSFHYLPPSLSLPFPHSSSHVSPAAACDVFIVDEWRR